MYRKKQNVKGKPAPASTNKRAKRLTIKKKKAQTKRTFQNIFLNSSVTKINIRNIGEPVKKIRRRTSTGWIDMDTDISLSNDNDLELGNND